jgi:hypothetical protein
MIGTRGRLVIGLAVLALVLAACGSSDSGSGDTTTTKAKTSSSTAKKSALPGCQNEKPDKPVPQSASVDPCKPLTDGQTVKVYVAGFTPGLTVGINECSTETDDSGSGCDLEGLSTMQIGADGTASADFVVKKGPFGKDQVTCTPPTQCLISVGELAAGEVERAPDVYLTFG